MGPFSIFPFLSSNIVRVGKLNFVFLFLRKVMVLQMAMHTGYDIPSILFYETKAHSKTLCKNGLLLLFSIRSSDIFRVGIIIIEIHFLRKLM